MADLTVEPGVDAHQRIAGLGVAYRHLRFILPGGGGVAGVTFIGKLSCMDVFMARPTLPAGLLEDKAQMTTCARDVLVFTDQGIFRLPVMVELHVGFQLIPALSRMADIAIYIDLAVGIVL
jgi:hypothetical protein